MKSKIESLLKLADSPAAQTSLVTSASRFFPTVNEATTFFQTLTEKLLHIEHWNKVSEISSFTHFDENGNARQPQNLAAVGSMVKVSLPGSGKDDWVKIIEIHDAPEEFVLTLQPSFDPTDKDNEKYTSHFLVNTSTNNFCLQRKHAKINFYVIGLGEKTNTADSGGLIETARNFAASNIGYFFGIQKAQWQTFCENFLEIE